MTSILVPVDGTYEADFVLPYLPALARSLGADVRLLRVVPGRAAAPRQPQLLAHEVGAETALYEPAPAVVAELAVEAYHQPALGYLRAEGLAAELEVVEGQPAEAIVERADAPDVAMVAMSTHGYGGLSRLVLGSVADKVMRSAPRPVFLTRCDGEPDMGFALRRILVPLDGSNLARAALPRAIELAVANNAQLTLLHVVVPPPMVVGGVDGYMPIAMAQASADTVFELQASARSDLHALARELAARHGLRVRCEIRTGIVIDELVEAVGQLGVDLVVMATHGYGGLYRWAFGSVADQAVHACPSPMLVIRPTT